VHGLLGVQLMAGVTVLVAGRSVFVKQVVAELEQMVDEEVHQGDMLVLQKDANAMPMMSTVVTVAVLRRSPLSFPVCAHSFGIPTHFILERFPNPSPSISSAQVLGITTPLRNCSPFVLCGIHLIQTSSRAHRLALGGFILSELRKNFRSPLHLRLHHLSGVPPLSQALLRDTPPVGPPLSAHRGPQTVPEPDRTNSGVESAEIPP